MKSIDWICSFIGPTDPFTTHEEIRHRLMVEWTKRLRLRSAAWDEFGPKSPEFEAAYFHAADVRLALRLLRHLEEYVEDLPYVIEHGRMRDRT